MSDKKLVVAPSVWQQFFDNNGNPLAGGKIYTYRAKTNIKQDTFKDSEGLALNENPIVLDASGFCRIFIENVKVRNEEREEDEAVGYRFEIYDKRNVLIRTIDPIFAISGIDGKNTGKIVRGPVGPKGDDGKSIPGESIKGDIGPRGFGGKTIYIKKTAGESVFAVPRGVDKIYYTIGAGGGGFYINRTLPEVGAVCTGTAGKIVSGEISVNEGDEIKLNIGAGGIVSKIKTEAMGKQTFIEHRTIGKIIASGGNYGTNDGVISECYQRMSPFLSLNVYNGEILNFVPRAIFGESTKYGQGGNIYMNNDKNPDATGNCSSGGSGEPTLSNNKMNIASFGKGGDGIIIFEYNIKEDK